MTEKEFEALTEEIAGHIELLLKKPEADGVTEKAQQLSINVGVASAKLALSMAALKGAITVTKKDESK